MRKGGAIAISIQVVEGFDGLGSNTKGSATDDENGNTKRGKTHKHKKFKVWVLVVRTQDC